MNKIKVYLDDFAIAPERAHPEDAGLDLKTPRAFSIPRNSSAVIDTGVHVEIPKGYAGFLKSKSGLNIKGNITTEGVIDTGYTGSIVVKIRNHNDYPVDFEEGSKITQLVLVKIDTPFIEIVNKDEFESCIVGDRKDNGFGSTGV